MWKPGCRFKAMMNNPQSHRRASAGSSPGRPGSGPRFWMLTILALWGWLWAASSAPSAAAALSMDLHPCRGIHSRANGAFAFSVELENQGEAFRGNLAITGITYGVRSKPLIQTVNLPRHAKQRYLFYLRRGNYYSPSITVTLNQGGREIMKRELAIKDLSSNDLFLVALTPEDSGFDYLAALRDVLKMRQDQDIVVDYGRRQGLPAHRLGWTGVDVVILARPAELNLSHEVMAGLAGWVRAGGSLVVISGQDPGELRGTPLESLLPGVEERTEIVSNPEGLAALGGYPLAPRISLPAMLTRPLPDSRILASLGSLPLITSREINRGRTYFIALDLSRPPLQGWTGSLALMGDVLLDDRQQGHQPSFMPDDLLNSLPEIKPPSLAFLAWFLVSYVLLVGPINYMFLKRKDRTHLLYLTVPVLALLFTAISYFTVLASKGANILLREVSVVSCVADSDQAEVTTFFSLFSPRRTRYRIAVKEPSAMGWELKEEREPSFAFQEQGGPIFGPFMMEMWSQKRFQLESSLSMSHPFMINLSRQDSRLSGTITSPLSGGPARALIYMDGFLTAPFLLSPGVNNVDMSFIGSFDQHSLGNALIDQLKIEDTRERVSTAPMYRELCDSLGHTLPGASPLLVIFSPEALVPLQVNRPGIANLNLTTYVVRF